MCGSGEVDVKLEVEKKLSKISLLCGAGDGARTRDNLLGRQGLCQLSYSRKTVSILTLYPSPVKGSLFRLLETFRHYCVKIHCVGFSLR